MSRQTSRLLLQPLLLLGIVSRWFVSRSKENPHRILIAHHLLLGDTLMLAPLLAKLRHRYPQAEIVMTCPKALVGLFALQPYGVSALAYDPADASTLYALWKKRGFDLALLPADNRMSWLARALGSRHTIAFAGDRPAYKNWFVDEFRSYPGTPMALPEIFALLLEGPSAPGFEPHDWPLPPCQSFNLPKTPYAVLHLGASSPLKFWSSQHWAVLGKWLNAQDITPVWSAGQREISLVSETDPHARFTSYAGQLNILQVAHLLRNASLLVCPDTGIAHLGRIVNVPTVTLFGPGSSILCSVSEFWKNSPYCALSAKIECRNQTNLFKRDASWVQRCARKKGNKPGQCPQARCMALITLDEVKDACQALLNAKTTAPASMSL